MSDRIDNAAARLLGRARSSDTDKGLSKDLHTVLDALTVAQGKSALALDTVQVQVSLIEGLLDDFGNRRARAVREACALLSQPTPSAELYRSIVQLAEGSTFHARQHGDPQERFWFLAAGMGVVSLDAIMGHANSIDPSTIRDVTPPMEQP